MQEVHPKLGFGGSILTFDVKPNPWTFPLLVITVESGMIYEICPETLTPIS